MDIAEGENDSFDTIFKPLSNHEYKPKPYQQVKKYGELKNSWLRIYAVRLEPMLYIVTGGAIKLTRSMQERAHTNEQYIRLNKVRDILIQNGFSRSDLTDAEINL